MKSASDTSYVDAKGRTRWQRNEWLAERLKELGEFLVIGGYAESHAVVYKRLSYTISLSGIGGGATRRGQTGGDPGRGADDRGPDQGAGEEDDGERAGAHRSSGGRRLSRHHRGARRSWPLPLRT